MGNCFDEEKNTHKNKTIEKLVISPAFRGLSINFCTISAESRKLADRTIRIILTEVPQRIGRSPETQDEHADSIRR